MLIRNVNDALSVLEKRNNILNYAKRNKDNMARIKNDCKKDIIFWLNSFCYTFDPRPNSPKNVPFMPYKYQERIITELATAILEGSDLLVEKSRDMGITWCVVYVFQWYWQFYNGYNFHLGSKKQDNVDVIGDPSTLFGKIRYNMSLQPKWLMPENYNPSKHSHLMRIINPENLNTITGESSNPEFSRSGRYSAVFFDEFAFWNYDQEAWSAAGDSTPCRIAVSTPFGKFNKFADLRFNSPIKIHTVHWKSHPFKTNEWYKDQKNRRTKDEIARELDINYLLSVQGSVYKDFDYATHVKDDLKPDTTLPIIRAWDFGLNPAVVFSQISPEGQWKIIDEVVPDLTAKPTISEYIPQVLEFCKNNYEGFEFKDLCDIAGKQRSSHTGKTDIDWLISFGVRPLYNYVKVEEGINLVASRMICNKFEPEPAFMISTKCEKSIEAFAGAYRRKKPTLQGQETPPTQEHPFEDVMDCIRYTAWQYFDASTGKRPKRRKRNNLPDNPMTGY